MSAEAVTVWVAAIAGAVGIISGLAIALLAERFTRQRWLRDKRADAYVHLVRTYRLLILTKPEAYLPDADLASDNAARNTEAIREMYDAFAEVEMVCTRNVREQVDIASAEIVTGGPPIDFEALQPKWDELIDALRADIGVKD